MTLVEQKPTVLRDWDPLVGQKISESLTEAGLTMKTGYTFEPEMLPADCDMVRVATGRLGNTRISTCRRLGCKGALYSDNSGAADTGFGVLEYLRNWGRERALAI